jgi:hypothetical protein
MNIIRRPSLLGWFAAWLFTLIPVSPVHALVVYDQPSDFPAGFGLASQNDTSSGGFGNFATTYDSFSLTVATPITDVEWQGAWLPTQGSISAFTLTFWDNSGANSTPGSALLIAHIPGNANETFVGSDVTGLLVFNYSADLPTPFSAVGGTTYWVSIVPDTPTTFPQWFWHTGLDGDARSVQDFFATGRSVIPNDLAFALTVPGPAPVAVLAAAALWFGVRSLRSIAAAGRRSPGSRCRGRR